MLSAFRTGFAINLAAIVSNSGLPVFSAAFYKTSPCMACLDIQLFPFLYLHIQAVSYMKVVSAGALIPS